MACLQRHDLEAANSGNTSSSDLTWNPFDVITTKNAPIEDLKRWRKSIIARNSTRRLHYTLNLEEAEATKLQMAKNRRQLQCGGYLDIRATWAPHQYLQRPVPNNRGVLGPVKGAAWFDLPRGAVTVVGYILHRTLTKDILNGMVYFSPLILGHFFQLYSILIPVAIDVFMLESPLSMVANKRHTWFEVIRHGGSIQVSLHGIAVGDVATLEVGDQVPGDGVLISGHSLAVDEFNLSGERKIVHKSAKNPYLMAGCMVTKGSGTIRITRVGLSTMWGNLMTKGRLPIGEETPLQVRLNGFATIIAKVGGIVSFGIFVVLLLRYFIGQFKVGQTSSIIAFANVADILLITIAMFIFGIPEELPINVTRMIAYSSRKIVKKKALIRRLSACETMGCATTICANKIEFLTTKMIVREAYICGEKLDSPCTSKLSSYLKLLLIQGIACNTNGVRYSPAEKAIHQWGSELGMQFDTVRSNSPILHFVPFNLEKKRGAVAVKQSNSKVHIHWKGDADVVLASCTKYIDSNDNSVTMNDKKRTLFRAAIEDFSINNMHSVAIAFRKYKLEDVPTSEEGLNEWELPGDDLTLLALLGLEDPCRPGMKNLVKACQVAGVKVRLITEDNLQRAKAIALECGILDPHADASEPLLLIDGTQFRSLSLVEREKIAEKVVVMGCSSPGDKLLLVEALKRQGQVVAVTGNASHDVSALNEADVGLAMNIQGTHAAKESSDVIILNDDFGTIVELVRWGRSVFSNIQNHVHFQLTVTISALVINLLTVVLWGDAQLTVIELYFIGTLVEICGAIAFVTEPPTDDLMRKPPIGRREHFVTDVMWRNLLVQVCHQVSVTLILKIWGRGLLNLENDLTIRAIRVKNTVIFNTFVLSQIFNMINARKHDEFNIFKGIFYNISLMMGIGFILMNQVPIIFFVGIAFGTENLNSEQWIISIVLAFISWPLAIIGKCLPVPSAKSLSFAKKVCPTERLAPPKYS